MEHFGGIALGLSLAFACLLLALLAEVFYLLWWRKRIRSVTDEVEDVNESTNYGKEIFHLICLKRPSSLNSSSTDRLRPLASNGGVGINEPDNQEQDPELGSSKDLLLKSEEESVDAELMRLHNLAGPPRFLFTIKEETKEDIESDDGKWTRKGSRTGSSDLLGGVETQVSPLKPGLRSNPNDSDTGFRFNPPVNSSSPPPKFKFLRDAEEKLLRGLVEEEAERKKNNGYGSLLKIGVLETKERAQDPQTSLNLRSFPSSSSQVLPRASCPVANFRSLGEKLSPVHRSK